MMRMRNITALMVALVVVAASMTSCGTSLTLNLAGGGAASFVDDLYGVHDVAALREAERIRAEEEAAARAANEKRIAAMIAAANAEADIDEILGDLADEGGYAEVAAVAAATGSNVNIYNNIYVDDYSSAYARRLQGFTSLTYRMPASYWDFRYGDAYFLTLAYDPAFYTVMVMGDQVWVEPRYITNMFGSWNNPYYYGYRYGYNPYYYGYSYGYYDPWGWSSPYWGCDPYYYWHHHSWYGPHYGHHHHHYHPSHHHPSHKPSGPSGPHGDRRSSVVYTPSYGMVGGGGSSARPTDRLSYGDRLGGTRSNGTDRGATVVGSSAGSSTRVVRPGNSSARPGSGTVTSSRNDNTRVESSVDRNPNTNVGSPSSSRLSDNLTASTLKEGSVRRGNSSTGVSNSSSRSSSRSSSGFKSASPSVKSTSRSTSSSSSSSSSSSVRSSRSSSSRSSSTTSRSSSISSSSRSSSSSMGSSRSSSSSSSRSSSSSSRSSRR